MTNNTASASAATGNNTNSSLEETPLVPSDISKQTLTLSGTPYTLKPSRLQPVTTIRDLPYQIVTASAKGLFLITAWPLILGGGILQFALMYLGPQSIRNRILGVMIPRIMKTTASRFDQERDELLSNIKDGDRVLDVGCGGGAYMRHFTKASSIVGLEPVVDMHEKVRQSVEEAGMSMSKVMIVEHHIEAFLEQQPEVVGTFDWVILGNVLCEVPNQQATLDAVNRALRPGGHVYFSEHVGQPVGTVWRRVQDWMNPWWKVVSGGCNCNCDTLQRIQQMRGWEVVSWRYDGIRVFMGPFILGLARKKTAI